MGGRNVAFNFFGTRFFDLKLFCACLFGCSKRLKPCGVSGKIKSRGTNRHREAVNFLHRRSFHAFLFRRESLHLPTYSSRGANGISLVLNLFYCPLLFLLNGFFLLIFTLLLYIFFDKFCAAALASVEGYPCTNLRNIFVCGAEQSSYKSFSVFYLCFFKRHNDVLDVSTVFGISETCISVQSFFNN